MCVCVCVCVCVWGGGEERKWGKKLKRDDASRYQMTRTIRHILEELQ